MNSDEDERSDEDKICVGVRGPQIIAKRPYVQTKHFLPPPTAVYPLVSSPDIAMPQLSATRFNECTMKTQHEVPEIGSVELSPTDTRSSDHVVIDIPNPDMAPIQTDRVPIPS